MTTESDSLLEHGLSHAWDWFALHANQRMQAVNFFILAAAFLSAAYVTALKDTQPVVALGVSVLAVCVSQMFRLLEERIRELVKAAESALRPAESAIAERTNIPEFRIVDRVETPTIRFSSYNKVIVALHWTTTIAFVLGALYAASLQWPLFHATRIATVKSALSAFAGLVLCWWARLILTNHVEPKRWYYIAAGIGFLISGCISLIIFAWRV